MLALILCGCNSSILSGDHGPNPILVAGEVAAGAQNTKAILDALAADYEIDMSASRAWYDVSLAGFNFVDDQCIKYFDDIFFLDREKDTVKGLLNSAAQTSSAILAVTNATKLSLTVVSQAFGFSSTATDLVAGTFLYQLPPATTLGFVKRQQDAFRAAVAAQVRGGPALTRMDAYHLIQQYLSYCLPPHIESELVKQISSSSSAPDLSAPAGTVAVLTATTPATPPPVILHNTPPPANPTPSVRPSASFFARCLDANGHPLKKAGCPE